MKLHLPKGLRAALIAALTVIGFTLPQTGASTTNGYNIIVFGEDEVSWADYRIDLDNLDNNGLPKGAALGDSGVTYTFEISGGKIWSHGADHTISVPDTWTADAITTMNTDMGTNLATTDLNGLHYIASAAGSSTTTFILNGSAGTGTAKIANGDTITLYIGITGTYDKAPVNYNITGLEDATIMYATADADFSSTPQFTANAKTLTLLQVTGTVSDATAISMYPTNVNNEKTGLAFVAYHSVKGEATDYIWSATGTSANWNDAVWTVGTATGQTIPDNAVAIFDTTATAKTVNFTEPETAKRITVSDNYTFAFAEGSGLNATRITIDAGKTLTASGSATMEIGTLDNFGTLNLADADTHMTVTNNFNIAAGSTFITAGSGTLAVNTFAVSGGTVTIGSNIEIVGGAPGTGANPRKQGLYITNGASDVKLLGALTNITGAMYANAGTVTVGDGENAARVETNRIEFGDLQGSAISTLNILKGATVHVKGEDNTDFGTTGMLFGEWDASSVANISGKLYGDNTTAYVGDKQATINIENGGVMAVKGIGITANKSGKSQILIVNLNDGGTLVLGENGMTSVKPLTATLGSGEIGISYSSVEIGAALTLSGSAETTFNTAMYTWQGSDDTLELEAGEDGGAITVSGNITGDGSLIKAGDGSLILSGTGNVITHTIDLQKGDLALSGTFDVSALASGGGTAKYVDGEVDGNGFLSHGELTAHVVDIADDATVSADGTFTVNGAAGTFDTNTGNAIFAAGATYTTLYVNVADSAEGLAHAIETAGAQGAEIAEVRLANSTTLNLNSADAVLPLLTVAAGADGALNVTENSSITKVAGAAEGHTLTVNGTGGITLTIGSAGADSLTSAGDLVIGEGATVLLQGNNTNFTGNLVINGTLKVGTGVNTNDGTNALGSDTIATTSTRSITVNSTGVLDFNGYPDTKYAYVLAGGKLTNTGATIGEGKAQMSGLKLTANSTVEANAAHEFWLLSSGYNPNTADLQGHTLVKTGDGQFGFRTTTITDGILEAQAGSIHFSASNNGNTNTVADMLLTGGTFTGAVDVKDDISVTTKATADMSAALNITESGKVVTFSVDADQTHTQSGAVSGSGSIVKQGAGTLVLSAANTLTSVTLSEGAIKAAAAGALGSGTTTVAAGTTLEMTVGNALSGTGSVSNAGNVLIHTTLTSGIITGGTLTLADDFAVTGDLEDVGGLTGTGNGFSLGGVMHVYTPPSASLTGEYKVMKGGVDYTSQLDANGDISVGGANWTVYQLNVENEEQPTIQQIIDYAAGKDAALASIAVNGDMLYLVDDSTTFKASMLSGTDEHLQTFILLLDNGAALGMDANLAGALELATDIDSHATVNLEKDATVGAGIWAYSEGGVADLTINGAHTLSTPFLGVESGTVTVQGGAHLAVTETDSFGMFIGDTLTVKGTSEFSIPNVSIKSVDGAKDAVLTDDSSEYAYDIADPGYTLADAKLTVAYTDDHELGHALSGAVAIVNAGAGILTDVNTANLAYDGLHAQAGNIVLQGRGENVAVRNLTVDAGRSVSMTDSTAGIVVSGTATFGNASSVGSALTMAGGSTLNGTTALGSHALSIERGVNIGEALWSTLSALAPEASTNIFTGVSALTLAGEEYTEAVDLKDIFNHTSLKANKFTLGYKDGNVVITKNLENNRYWKGGTGTWNTTDALWTDEETGGSDVAFVNGYNAHFTKDGGLITLGEDITAANVYVSGSGANFAFKDGGHTLTVTNLFEVDGASMATVAFGLNGENLKLSAKNGAQLVLTANSSVKSVEIGSGSMLDTGSANLTVEDSLINNGTLNAGTLTLQKGTAQGGKAAVGTLALTSGESYNFSDLTVTNAISGTGASLAIAAGGKMYAGTATLQNLTLGGAASVDSNVTVTGTTTVNGAASLVGKLTTGSLAGGGVLTLNSGDLAFTAPATVGANVSFTGTSSITGTVTLGGALSNAGTLTLNGTYDASNLTATPIESKYVEGGTDGNGFEKARLTLTIVNGGTTSASGATITFRGKTLSEKVDSNGSVTFDGDVDYTKYYVNTGTENASKALGNPNQKLGTFELKAGTKLVADRDFDVSKVNDAGAATLEIADGHTVTSNGAAKSLTLTGAGTYALASGVSTLGVTVGGAWAGTVSYTEAGLTTLDGAWNNASTVSLTGVTGSLGGTAVGAAVVLNKGEGDWGFGLTAGGTQSVTLNGAITGEGNLGVKGGSSTSTFTLGGNIDGWNGNFVAGSANATLKLTGSDKTVNGSVNGSNLALVVETNTTLKSDSTVARVNATNGSLKVDDGKTLTVTDSILPNNIKLGAGASIVAAFMGGAEYGYQDGIIANGTDSDQNVTIDNANITVTGATLATGGATAFTVDNKLADAKLLVAESLTAAVALNNVQDSLEVDGDLAIGTGGSLKVAKSNGADRQDLIMGSGTTLTTAAGSVVDANLTLSGNVTAAMAAALDMNGGALTLNTGLTLSGALYDAVAGLTVDDPTVNLFENVGVLTLVPNPTSTQVKALQYFTNLGELSDNGDYFLQYDGANVSIYFTPTSARTLTWNGTEEQHGWEMGEDTAKNWLVGDPATETHFGAEDNARFTADAAKKLVTITEDIAARNVTVTDARYLFENGTDRTITAEQFSVQGSTLSKKGAGELVLDIDTAVSVKDAAFEVQEGSVVIGTPTKPGTLELTGSVLDVALGASLTVATIHADAGPNIELGGTLTVANGSLVYLTALDGSLLRIADVGETSAGTLAVGADAYLYGLENHGTLDLGTHGLTLKQATAQGGNVTAGTISLKEYGSSFGNVAADTIHLAYGMLDVADPNVTVDTITANTAASVTLDLTEALTDSGSLSPMQRLEMPMTYTLVHADSGLGTTSFTLGDTLGLLVQNGLIHEGADLTVTDNDVKLTVGGQNLTWYTSRNSTEWGYNVVTGGNIAHGANTLNGVQRVVVDQSLALDVTGVGAAPGLRMRNLFGVEGETLTLTGGHEDTVTLITTEDTESAVGLNAEGIAIHVGLDAYDDFDTTDYAKLKVGALDLEDAALIVNSDASFTVDTLYGDDASLLGGKVVVEGQGGYYSGRYAGAEVVLHEDAVQTLAAGEGLTVEGDGTALLAYSGAGAHIDGIQGLGLTLVLSGPNEDGTTPTLVLDEASSLEFGSIHAGISAIGSALTLDTDDVPDLVEAESLNLDYSTIVLHQAEPDGAALAMATTEGAQKKGICLAHLGADDSTAEVELDGYLLEKYYENARLEGGRVLVDRRTDFYSDLTQAQVHAPNAQAGAGLLDDALEHSNPQVTNPEGDLSNLMTALELGYVPQRRVEKVMAAVSGASHAALGAAWSHDVDRQLRAIRNRTAQMGLSGDASCQGLPYFNAWINAEGDYHKLNADGLMPGYKMSSWGATLGFDVDCTPRFTFGVAFSALSGDFTAYSEDRAEGDLDRMYVSVFGRYTHRAWTHTLVFTYGSADTKIDRTVDYAAGSYSGTTESDGSAWGLMYELGYVAALNEDASTCLQPIVNVSYRQSSLNGAKETSASDAALEFGDAEAKLFTAAVGARLQSVIGTNIYNRASLFEGRVLFKFDSGDRAVEARNSLVGVPGGRSVKSAEVGVFGVEVGAGITIPMAENAGALFLDVTGDFRSKYTEINGTVGYRFNF